MKKIKLMTHVVIGYPSLADTVTLVQEMADAGVDMVELQIPFSDPLADGPAIMKACESALASGIKVKDALVVMQSLSKKLSIPLLFMSYYNIIFRYGTEKFIKDAKQAGAYGLIVPDMPIDEDRNEHFYSYCKKYGVHPICVISPNATDERISMIAKKASGFIYVTTRQGTTGVANSLNPSLNGFLKKIREYLKIPIAVGFGISKKGQIHALLGSADIAVIGSKIIDIIDSSAKEARIKKVGDFIKSLRV